MEKTVGILVDYELYLEHEGVHDWLRERYGKARFVALVSDPDVDELVDHGLWDVIIKNHKGWSDAGFKASALLTIKEASNIIPVIALDDFNFETYERYGVLVQMVGNDFG